MKLSVKLLLMLGLILLAAPRLFAQKVYTIQVGNERLLILLDSLSSKNMLAQKLGNVDSAFTFKMQNKIDSIQTRALERKKFIGDLKKINSKTLSAKLNKLEYESLNKRLYRESGPLATDFAYADILLNILDISEDFKKNKKVYFANGKYKIPNALKSKAKKVFQPITDDIIRLGNRFKEMPFDVVIKTVAYSDERKVYASSALYADLAERMQSDELTQNEIQMYVSNLRAYDVSSILEDLWSDRKSYLIREQNISIQYEKLGRGNELPPEESEALPSKKRRVVYVDWYILPKF